MSTRLPIRRNVSCVDLAELLLDLKPLDVETYRALLKKRGGGSVEEIADALDRERTSAYRSLERLTNCDLVDKESEIRMRKRYYVYRPVTPRNVRQTAEECLEERYEELREAVDRIGDGCLC